MVAGFGLQCRCFLLQRSVVACLLHVLVMFFLSSLGSTRRLIQHLQIDFKGQKQASKCNLLICSIVLGFFLFSFLQKTWLEGHWNLKPLATITLFYYYYYYPIFVVSSPLFLLKNTPLSALFFPVEDALNLKGKIVAKASPMVCSAK